MRMFSAGIIICFAATSLSCGDSAISPVLVDINQTVPDNSELLENPGDSSNDLVDAANTAVEWPECDDKGAAGCPCNENSECAKGYCVATGDGKVCTDTCVEECPIGWECAPVTNAGSDVTFICVPKYTNLCRPCESGEECAQLGGNGSFCVEEQGGDGSYCSPNCSDDKPCPADYECSALETKDGNPISRCRPTGGKCSCNLKAQKEEASTTCWVSNSWGTCTGTRVCSADGLSDCGAQTPAEEICDGMDNNCNGAVDEDFPDFDNDGTLDCLDSDDDGDNDPDDLDCEPLNPNIHHAATEICDGLDNNCSDSVDEDLGETSCGEGVCATTVPSCIFGKINECKPLIQPGELVEVCDGLDNNCDGNVDEAMGESSCGQGECVHSISNCLEGIPQFCDPFEGLALAEICDGKDNNCNGESDEGLGESTCGKGQCAHTVQNCVDGAPQFCDPFEGASPEVCDGKDNNCNGESDEALGESTCGKGECTNSVQNCVDGKSVVCDPLLGSKSETCDGKDNNCNGESDENLGSTTCGKGECINTVQNCVDGKSVSCDPFLSSKDEICDGKDNNCNGVPDEDLGSTTCGKGECINTVQNCVDGKSVSCDPFLGAKQEICDGTDNNCDGKIDEGCPPLGEQVIDPTFSNVSGQICGSGIINGPKSIGGKWRAFVRDTNPSNGYGCGNMCAGASGKTGYAGGSNGAGCNAIVYQCVPVPYYNKITLSYRYKATSSYSGSVHRVLVYGTCSNGPASGNSWLPYSGKALYENTAKPGNWKQYTHNLTDELTKYKGKTIFIGLITNNSWAASYNPQSWIDDVHLIAE
ncbi:MAG TPA: hypothetical protein EYN66_23750 [Myxococcales bacterium]|nr:hypothetical protein [Myxococcales bacterium]